MISTKEIYTYTWYGSCQTSCEAQSLIIKSGTYPNRYDSRRAVRSLSVAGAYSRVRVVPSDTTLLVLVEGVYALFITAKLRLWYLCYKLHIILQ